MAVVEMSKLRLVGLNADKDRLLNSLQKTNAVQISTTRVVDGATEKVTEIPSDVTSSRETVALALSILEKTAYEKGDKTAISQIAESGFAVDGSEFSTILNKSKEVLANCNEIIKLNSRINEIKADVITLQSEIDAYEPYYNVKEKFSAFKSGETFTVTVGLVPLTAYEKVKDLITEINGAEIYSLASQSNYEVISVLSYKCDDAVLEVLASNGFTRCEFFGDYTAEEKITELTKLTVDYEREVLQLKNDILKFAESSREIKILSDRLSFEVEKITESDKFKVTDQTFIMEAFVPTKLQEKVSEAIIKTTENCYYQYDGVTEDDLPPTYLENGKIASNFEFVTNMYSVPKYGALDPNGVMGFFFSLFLGIITADAGYGLLLAIGGFLFAKFMAKGEGIKKLANVLALGGIFAIPFGVLFDSFLGFQIIHKICEAKLGVNNAYATFFTKNLDAISSFSSLAGISVPTMLLWSLLFGALHLSVGYILKGIHDVKNKRYADGIIDGFCWALFLIGFSMFAFSLVEGISEKIYTPMQNIGIAVFAVGLGVAVIFAGRNNKGFGKVTGAFGALYGIINILSDILSYARLYGLMLSGSQVASIFTNTIAVNMLFPSGVLGVIFGIVVIIVGNLFNLAMGVLGAYIHDSRLQYVEFFGKFYEGDGELFAPLGSKFNYVYTVNK